MEAGRKLVLKALVGSHNYNLNNEESDKDYKSFVFPTFNDLYSAKNYVEVFEQPNEDVTVHDIRQLSDLLYKSNVNFLEVLFSEELIFGSTLKAGEGAYIIKLFERREEIASINLYHLYHSCMGTYFNRKKYLKKGTEKTRHLVENFGYDTKQAMQCARILDVLIRYEGQNFQNFKSAIWFESDSFEYQELQRIRQGAYSEKEILAYLENKKNYVETRLKENYIYQENNIELAEWVEQQIKELIQYQLREELSSLANNN